MSSKKEEKSQDAADRIKAAALNAAKGLSRAQAERAAAAAARNVNAYGQKEEGPSRWQERKEAKRQMYLMSTEKAVKLGERKDLKSSFSGGSAQCQKCFQTGHWTYACKNERVYISRPSRTQQLKNPKLKMKFSDSYELDNPENPLVGNRGEDEPSGSGRKKLDKGRGKGKKTKRKHSDSESESDASEASVFSSDSESSDEGSSGTDSDNSSDETNSRGSSSESESEDERIRRKKRKQKKRRHHKHRRSSAFSDSESDYDSDSDEGSRKKSRKRR